LGIHGRGRGWGRAASAEAAPDRNRPDDRGSAGGAASPASFGCPWRSMASARKLSSPGRSGSWHPGAGESRTGTAQQQDQHHPHEACPVRARRVEQGSAHRDARELGLGQRRNPR
jgi:hypothetical protein